MTISASVFETSHGIEYITGDVFAKLPKNEQDFRWVLFLESDGYKKTISNDRIRQLKKEYGID